RVQFLYMGRLCSCCHDFPFPLVTQKTLANSSGDLADGAQETPPALPFRYPGNFIRESIIYFGQCLPIPMRENSGFVTHTHAGLGTLWHWCRLLNGHSSFCAHCLTRITIQIVNRYL